MRKIIITLLTTLVLIACKPVVQDNSEVETSLISITDGLVIRQNASDLGITAANVDINIDIVAPDVTGSASADLFTNELNNFITNQHEILKQSLALQPVNTDIRLHYQQFRASSLPLISLVIQHYRYTGGANGMQTSEAIVFNTQTGNEVSFDTLFTNEALNYFITNINQRIATTNRLSSTTKPSPYYPDALVNELTSQSIWYIDGDTLISTFAPITIGPHSSGQLSFSYPLVQLQQQGMMQAL
jgi:hypothetical protein